MSSIKFSLFASPRLLTKRINLIDGKLVKMPAANSVAGVKRITVAALAEVMAVLDNLTDKHAACWGVSIADSDESVVETAERVESGQAVAGAISRTRKFMTWANAAGVFMADLDANDRAWGPRGYRYAMMTAGRMGQRLYLTATAMGLGCCGIGAFYDGEAGQFLGLARSWSLLYLVAAGEVKGGRQ